MIGTEEILFTISDHNLIAASKRRHVEHKEMLDSQDDD